MAQSKIVSKSARLKNGRQKRRAPLSVVLCCLITLAALGQVRGHNWR